MKNRTVKVLVVMLSVLILLTILFLLIWNGVILLNNPSDEEYPVRGVDVSAYQGDIDWSVLSEQNISFAFIKATEGSSFVDKKFEYNFTQAQKENISVGAYHFFSFDSKGKTQAENFIKTVIPFESMLPPVIDFEFYGDKEKNPPLKEDVTVELNDMIAELEAHYGLSPIIYATEKSYRLYLENEYEEYDIWIRDVVSKPELPDGKEWTFWQFTDREKLEGYNGVEKFIDVNVYCGSEEEFSKYPRYGK